MVEAKIIKVEPRISLEMSQQEASFLRDYCRDFAYPGEEAPNHASMRGSIFIALKEVLDHV